MNYENALRKKYRFPSVVGELTLEQLWDLPLLSGKTNRPDLDGTAKLINHDLKAQAEDSFVTTTTNTKKIELAEKLEIVKHVIAVQQAENAAERSEAERKRQKQQLTEILHLRTQQDLMSKSPAEIEAMIAALDKPA